MWCAHREKMREGLSGLFLETFGKSSKASFVIWHLIFHAASAQAIKERRCL